MYKSKTYISIFYYCVCLFFVFQVYAAPSVKLLGGDNKTYNNTGMKAIGTTVKPINSSIQNETTNKSRLSGMTSFGNKVSQKNTITSDNRIPSVSTNVANIYSKKVGTLPTQDKTSDLESQISETINNITSISNTVQNLQEQVDTINLDNYYTTEEVDTFLNDYYTTVEIDEKLSNIDTSAIENIQNTVANNATQIQNISNTIIPQTNNEILNLQNKVSLLENASNLNYSDGIGVVITNANTINLNGLTENSKTNNKAYVYKNGAFTELQVLTTWSDSESNIN